MGVVKICVVVSFDFNVVVPHQACFPDSMIAFAEWIDDFAPPDPETQPQVVFVTTSLSYYVSWFHMVCTLYLGEHLGATTQSPWTSRH